MTPEFFAACTVSELAQQSDYWLEEQGRLTEPMRYNGATDRYEPIGWEDAFAMIGAQLRALESPGRADFYTSGRTSNEAAFLYQIFVRRFGCNNFPDCSNMCHEATSVGLPESIGIGKGTVVLEDFEKTDAIFVIGKSRHQQPADDTPLREASRRGVPIVAMNPLRERALERFAAPQTRSRWRLSARPGSPANIAKFASGATTRRWSGGNFQHAATPEPARASESRGRRLLRREDRQAGARRR